MMIPCKPHFKLTANQVGHFFRALAKITESCRDWRMFPKAAGRSIIIRSGAAGRPNLWAMWILFPTRTWGRTTSEKFMLCSPDVLLMSEISRHEVSSSFVILVMQCFFWTAFFTRTGLWGPSGSLWPPARSILLVDNKLWCPDNMPPPDGKLCGKAGCHTAHINADSPFKIANYPLRIHQILG